MIVNVVELLNAVERLRRTVGRLRSLHGHQASYLSKIDNSG